MSKNPGEPRDCPEDDVDLPAVVMSHLPGGAKPPAEVGTADVIAIYEVHQRIHSLPVPDGLPDAINHSAEGLRRTRIYLDDHSEAARDLSPAAESLEDAWKRASEWVHGPEASRLAKPGDSVFCRGDVNLINYLWADGGVKAVDFEDAGLNDPCFELADMAEHPNSRQVAEATWDLVAEEFHLDRETVLTGRYLQAIFWMTILARSEGARRINPPGALEELARRVLGYLGG